MGTLHSLAVTVRDRWVAMAFMYAIGFWSVATIVSPLIQWKVTSIERIVTGLLIGFFIALLERNRSTPGSPERARRLVIALVIFGVLFVVAITLLILGVQ